MKPRSSIALAVARFLRFASLRLRRGGGSALPGLVALAIAPRLLEELRGPLHQLIVVSGTNGKTTTSLFLREILRFAGLRVVGNETGSNLSRGIASALIEAHDRLDGATAVLEVDEAVLPDLCRTIKPNFVMLNNLFRDQLDRYGEVDSVANSWIAAFGGESGSAGLILNADDPVLAAIGTSTSATVTFFGLEDTFGASHQPEHGADPRRCPLCGGELVYSAAFFGHVGHYGCSRFDWRRPTPDVFATDLDVHGVERSSFRLTTPRGDTTVRLRIGGLFNVYNAVAAAAVASAIGIPASSIVGGLEAARPAFGRLQQFEIMGKRARMLLIKNPVGASAVLRSVFDGTAVSAVLLALNDGVADGADVSWIWDIDLSGLLDATCPITVSGIRADDMALRLKYEGIDPARVTIEPSLARALSTAAASASDDGELMILPTYTAMLDLQRITTRLGATPDYWETARRLD